MTSPGYLPYLSSHQKPLSCRLAGNKNPHSFSSLLFFKNVHSFDFIFSNINGEKHVHCKKKQTPIKKKTLQCTQFSPPGQNERKNELHMTAGGVLFCLMQCRQLLERVVSKSQWSLSPISGTCVEIHIAAAVFFL